MMDSFKDKISEFTLVQRAVFLDLNGTIVEPVQVENLSELRLIEGTLEAISKLNKAGFICPVVTVQSRIAKGYFSETEFLIWFEAFAKQALIYGTELLGPYVCPHRFDEPCICEKPKPYLYLQAASDYAIDLKNSVVIGDTASDIEAGLAIGSKSCLVTTGWGHYQNNQEKARALGVPIARNLSEAVGLFS